MASQRRSLAALYNRTSSVRSFSPAQDAANLKKTLVRFISGFGRVASKSQDSLTTGKKRNKHHYDDKLETVLHCQ